MVARCKHETVWLAPTYIVTLTRISRIKGENKDTVRPLFSTTLTWSTFNSSEFRNLQALLATRATKPETDIITAFNTVVQRQQKHDNDYPARLTPLDKDDLILV